MAYPEQSAAEINKVEYLFEEMVEWLQEGCDSSQWPDEQITQFVTQIYGNAEGNDFSTIIARRKTDDAYTYVLFQFKDKTDNSYEWKLLLTKDVEEIEEGAAIKYTQQDKQYIARKAEKEFLILQQDEGTFINTTFAEAELISSLDGSGIQRQKSKVYVRPALVAPAGHRSRAPTLASSMRRARATTMVAGSPAIPVPVAAPPTVVQLAAPTSPAANRVVLQSPAAGQQSFINLAIGTPLLAATIAAALPGVAKLTQRNNPMEAFGIIFAALSIIYGVFSFALGHLFRTSVLTAEESRSAAAEVILGTLAICAALGLVNAFRPYTSYPELDAAIDGAALGAGYATVNYALHKATDVLLRLPVFPQSLPEAFGEVINSAFSVGMGLAASVGFRDAIGGNPNYNTSSFHADLNLPAAAIAMVVSMGIYLGNRAIFDMIVRCIGRRPARRSRKLPVVGDPGSRFTEVTAGASPRLGAADTAPLLAGTSGSPIGYGGTGGSEV